jgi:hypothetical protein
MLNANGRVNMRFAVYGAYKLPRINGLINDSAASKRSFWEQVDEDIEGLSDACGCYIFAAQNRPWYVGLAVKQSFKQECLTYQKVNTYNKVLADYERAAPWLYFIAKLTPGGNFSSPSKNGHSDIEALEKILIGLAISRNNDVANIRGTKFLREMNVPGIINTESGQGRAYAVQEIRDLFGI